MMTRCGLKILTILFLVSCYSHVSTVLAQEVPYHEGTYVMKDNLSELPQNTPGYPDRSPDFDVLPGFKNVPNGYGPVPFYWWVGENLTRERLLWQLDKVHQAGIEGLSIS